MMGASRRAPTGVAVAGSRSPGWRAHQVDPRARGQAARARSPPDPYYASSAAVGPARLLANLQESAWRQAALSERMGAYVGWALLTTAEALLRDARHSARRRTTGPPAN